MTVVSGSRSKTYRPTIPSGGQIDATGATFVSSPTNKYPVQAFGTRGSCWRGGMIQGTFLQTLTWGEMHDKYNPTAFAIYAPELLVEGVRVDNGGDGIAARAEDFTVRNVHLRWIRDDAFDDTAKHSGVIDDSFIESTYVGISTRGDTPAAPDAIVTVRNSLFALTPMPGPHSSEKRNPGHGNLLKTDEQSPQFVLENVTVFATQQTSSEGGLGLSSRTRIKKCSNNLWVYTGKEPLDEKHLGKDPETGQPCFKVSRDRADWDAKVAQWKAAHP